jgi:N,N'-diacetylchitobiose transport system permease protein
MSAAGSTSTLTSSRRPGSEQIESPRRGKRRSNRVPVLLALPAGLILLALLGYPILLAVELSFQKYGLKELIQRHGEWIGFENYTSVLTDRFFWTVLLRTIVFVLVTVGLTMVIGTLVALLMNRLGTKMRLLVSIGLLLAWATPPVTAATIWKWLFDSQWGLVNWALVNLGFESFRDHGWFLQGLSALAIIVLTVVWQSVPFVALTVYAGLTSVPKELYEAARVDGANGWTQFRAITWSMLKPIFLILTVLSVIWDFRVTTQVFVLTRGGPAKATTMLGYYAYTEGFATSQYGRAAAIGVIMVVIVMVFTAYYVRQMAREEEV